MALNAFSNHPSSSDRQKLFPRNLIGDFTSALERRKKRQEILLQENISQVLDYHEKRLEGGPIFVVTRPFSAGNSHNIVKDTTRHNPTAIEPDRAVSGLSMNGASTSARSTITSKEAAITVANMAADSRLSRPKAQVRDRVKRRSDRFKEVMDRLYNQAEAELILDLSNIRKKLNFKTNFLHDAERPAKRQKRDTVRCYCHLTIWDNRDGHAAIPLTTKSEYCHVTAVDNGIHGTFVDLELETPFVIKAAEIRVPVTTKQVSALEIIDKYFLEFKIIPCRTDSRWPPMSLLGKSDGDHFVHDVKKAGSEELQGALVARYTHLPTAPDPDIPFSVFYLEEGKTYRTKYGLQVQSYWQRAGTAPLKRESHVLDLDSFLRERPHGVYPPKRPKLDLKRSGTEQVRESSSIPPQTQPELCYSFSPRRDQHLEVAQEFRDATLRGYCCPICPLPSFEKLQRLQFHLSTMHSKYNFSVQRTHGLSQIHIKVEKLATTTVKKEAEQTIAWIAPTPPFDLDAYVSGNHSWTKGIASTTKTQTSRGHPLARNVPDFRKPHRKKLKAITLETRCASDDPESVYTSISHRPVSPSEDPQSETDDEIDNEWQISTHMEHLDLIATKENWSGYKRELTKRWDRHRMEEQLEHSAYLSNSLVRFVRKQKSWLNSEDDDLLQCFFDFLARLKDRRVIDDNVIADVNELVFADAPPQVSPAKKAPARQKTMAGNVSDTSAGGPLPQPPTSTSSASICALCSTPVVHSHKTAVFCQDPSCATPLQEYHRKCMLSSQKGKEKATTPEQEALRLTTWSCRDCAERQKEEIQKSEEEREEKRRREMEVVEKGARAILGSMA